MLGKKNPGRLHERLNQNIQMKRRSPFWLRLFHNKTQSTLVRQVLNGPANPVKPMLLRDVKIEIDRFSGDPLLVSEFLRNPVRCLARHIIVGDLAESAVEKFCGAVEYCWEGEHGFSFSFQGVVK